WFQISLLFEALHTLFYTLLDDLHFTAANVVLGNEVSVDSGSSSSGCNAGAASLMLLIGALPLLYFRKK
ncbi:MAG: Synerg-CTERM sorting domain-containing protein, partial [bacterium]|nr:Synerg-CTERM sorting domain-containing protein [bacterium]